MLPDPARIYHGIETIMACGQEAGRYGLVDGFSGNLSLRLERELFLITGAGSVKGSLAPEDFVLTDGRQLGGAKKPSSESGLHTAIFRAYPQCAAIAHTHPGALQALEILGKLKSWQTLPLYEADIWKNRLAHVPPMAPGTAQLGETCVAAMKEAWSERLPMPCGAWLMGHGLVACGENLQDCIAFQSELEHLARIGLEVLGRAPKPNGTTSA